MGADRFDFDFLTIFIIIYRSFDNIFKDHNSRLKSAPSLVQDISSVYQIFADDVLGSGQFGIVYGGETFLQLRTSSEL